MNWERAKKIAKAAHPRCRPSRPTGFSVVDGVVVVTGEGGETVVLYGKDVDRALGALAIVAGATVVYEASRSAFAASVLEADGWTPPAPIPLNLPGMDLVDGRSQRWGDAEERFADITEEQAAYDMAHSEDTSR